MDDRAHPLDDCAGLDRELLRLDPNDAVKWLQSLGDIEACIEAGLRDGLADADWFKFETYVMAAYLKPSRAFTRLLCGALDARAGSDVNYENVVDALGEIADPSSLPCLERALYWEPDWDVDRQLGVKVVWAISRIGTEAAREVLVRLAGEDDMPELQEWARWKLADTPPADLDT